MGHIHVPRLNSSTRNAAEQLRMCIALGNWHKLVENAMLWCLSRYAKCCYNPHQVELITFGVDSGTFYTVHPRP